MDEPGTPFFHLFFSCEAMEFTETGHRREERPNLPVSLLMVLHNLRLECGKSMEFTASPIAPASSVRAEKVGTKRLYQSQSPLRLGWMSDRGSRTLCPSMAHSSSGGHVGCIVWPQIVGSRTNPGMPSHSLVCAKVAISQWIHLWESKSASNQELAKVPTLHRVAVDRIRESWRRYDGGQMLWPRELS